jgi:hypothetical protein
VAAEFVELTYLGVSYRIPHMADDKPTIAKTSVRMPEEALSKTAVVLPETAVKWAWGLTAKYSEKMEGKIDADYTQQQMKEIKNNVVKGSKEDKYLNNLYSAVNAAVRTLVIAINGRNHNFKEVHEVIEKQTSIIDNTKRLTANLQSIAPRLAAISVGGVALPTLFTWLIQAAWPGKTEPVISENVFPLVTVLAIGLSYFLHERFIVPSTVKKHQQLLIYGEYFRNQYYHNWIIRVRETLKSLLRESINIYQIFYGDYAKNSVADIKQYVDDLIVGIGPKPLCCFVHACMEKTMNENKEKVIDFHIWSKCESGIGVKECEVYKSARANG